MSVTPQKAAEISGLSRPSIMHAITSGKLPAKRANSGNKWLIEEADLEAWMRSRIPRDQLAKTATYTATTPSPTVNEGEDTQALVNKIKDLEGQVNVLKQKLLEAQQGQAKSEGALEERGRTIETLSGLLNTLAVAPKGQTPENAPSASRRRGWWPWSRG